MSTVSGEIRDPHMRWTRRARHAAACAVVTVVGMATLGAASAAAADFQWSPPGTSGNIGTSGNFSTAADWLGGVAPSGSIGVLQFGHPIGSIGECELAGTAHATDDIPGLGVNQLVFPVGMLGTDEIDSDASHDPLTLGAGGISVGANTGAAIEVPVTLSAAQTWIDPCALSAANVTGAYPVAVNLASPDGIARTSLAITGEIGSLTVDGTAGLSSMSLSGDLNGQDGEPITITDTGVEASTATTGPLLLDGAGLNVGSSQPGVLGVAGPLSLTNTSVNLGIAQAGTDASEIVAASNVTLSGVPLSLSAPLAVCPSLAPGTVLTLLATGGTLTGTFAGLPDGSTVSLSGTCMTATGAGMATDTLQLHYTTSTVTATVLTASGTPGLANTSAPTISGRLAQGETLTEGHGGWASTPTSYAYQWQDCNTSGASCSGITGATGPTYTLAAGDVGDTIRVQETAFDNGVASSPAASQATGVILPAPPANTGAPTIAGTARQGQILADSNGTWSGAPTSYTYQWEDCNTAGNACSPIAGATAQEYELTPADVGNTIRVSEAGVNAGGSGTPASSSPTAVVAAALMLPANTKAPVVTGTASVGKRLSVTTGTWTGTAPITYTYQWFRCTPKCVTITTATGSSYTPSATDIGARIEAAVIATNAAGVTAAATAATGPVRAAAPTSKQVRSALKVLLSPANVTAPRTAFLKSGGYVFVFNAPSPGTLAVKWYASGSTIVLASATHTFTAAGRATVKIHLTASGRKTFGTAQRVTLLVKASFQPSTGSATAVKGTRTVTIKS